MPKHHKSSSRIFGIIFGSLIVLGALIWMLVSMFRYAGKDQPITYGVSFSAPQAEYLGLDWQDTYQAILSDLQVKKLRLMSYWSVNEPQMGVYNFTDLDKQFQLASQYGVKVSLAIGLRQPRWPECHEPAWAKELSDEQWQAHLQSYITEVVNRYKDNPALESWQLENEYYNKDFGANCRNHSQARLSTEYNLVKQLDKLHPIIMNQSNQVGLPLRAPHPNIYGFSIYKRVFDARILKRYITHPIPAWFHSLRAMAIENIWHKPVIIHELQAEPWSNKPLLDTPQAEQDQTMSLTQLKRNLEFAKRSGIKEQYLWGAEWWYWQKSKMNNPAYWDYIKQAIANE